MYFYISRKDKKTQKIHNKTTKFIQKEREKNHKKYKTTLRFYNAITAMTLITLTPTRRIARQVIGEQSQRRDQHHRPETKDRHVRLVRPRKDRA